MATGDLQNNLRKLKNVLKSIKYDSADNLDVSRLSEGNAAAYLPIYHYVFTSYSPKVAEFILSRNFELYGKTDARFMEVVYKIMRDLFSYVPPISKDKFFAKGFVERKLIMCTEILQMVKNKHMELNPGPSKTAMKTSVRPKSAPERKQASGILKNKPTYSARISPRNTDKESPRQVVNELVAVPEDPPIRHTYTAPDPRTVTRHIAGKSGDSSIEFSRQTVPTPQFITKRSGLTSCENASQLGMKTTLDSLSQLGNSTSEEEYMPPLVNKQTLVYPETPAIRHHQPSRVEVVSMPKRTEVCTPDISIVDIQASTSVSMIQDPVIDTQQVREMCKNVEDLSLDLNQQFNNSVAALHSEPKQTDPYVIALETRIQKQLENLQAQLTLMNNRLYMVEAKLDMRQSTSFKGTGTTVQTTNPHVHTNGRVVQTTNAHVHTNGRVVNTANTDVPTNGLKANTANTHTPVIGRGVNTSLPINCGGIPSANTDALMNGRGVKTENTHVPMTGQGVYIIKTNEPMDCQGALQTNTHEHMDGREVMDTPEQRFLSDPRVKNLEHTPVDISLNYSPIRRIQNPAVGEIFSANDDTFMSSTAEVDSRRSSTPTHGVAHCKSEPSFLSAASRIEQMFQETNKMIMDKPDIPSLRTGVD